MKYAALQLPWQLPPGCSVSSLLSSSRFCKALHSCSRFCSKTFHSSLPPHKQHHRYSACGSATRQPYFSMQFLLPSSLNSLRIRAPTSTSSRFKHGCAHQILLHMLYSAKPLQSMQALLGHSNTWLSCTSYTCKLGATLVLSCIAST